MSIRTKAFWVAAAERALKTVAQSALALLTVDATTTVISVDWTSGAAVAATAGIVSLLTSIVSENVGPSGSPSLTDSK